MCKRMLVLSVLLLGCFGVTCRIVPGGGSGDPLNPSYIPLDEADAAIIITQTVDADTASVVATINDEDGGAIEFDNDQSVTINGEELSGPNSSERFTATVDADSEYTVTVREPTRGVERTTVDVPADFAVTSPAAGGSASLTGFTLQWSRANDRLQVEIEISQTIRGETETRTFGPFTDTGSREFEAAELIPYFVQGEDLEITVTKISERDGVAGFNSGSLTVRVSATTAVDPTP